MSSASVPLSAPSNRLMSVDALRGFDMFWIIGAGSIVKALESMGSHPVMDVFATQLQHVPWEGFHFYDVIFPLFLFIVGVSLVFSLDKAFTEGGRSQVMWRVFRRSLLLFAIGIFYYGGLSKPWPEIQLGGVLHRIAACYLFGALIYTFVRGAKGLVAVSTVLLIGYWGLVTYVPFPDLKLDKSVIDEIATRIGSDSPHAIAHTVNERISGSYEEGRNLVNYLDFLYLPGKKPQLYYINEGLLSTLPAIALTLWGAVAGLLFKNQSIAPKRKIVWLLVAGAMCVVLGLMWSLQFPLIKRIWTSSFVLVAGGSSMLLMAVFYWIVDVMHWRNWCQPFVWIGANALTIYVVAKIVNFQNLATYFVGGDVKSFFDTHVAPGFGGVVIALVGLLLAVLLARFLYLRNCLIRV